MPYRHLLHITALITIMPLASAAEDWPGWRGLDRTGVSDETGWKADWGTQAPPILWQKQLGPAASCVAVVGDRAYVMGNVQNNDVLYCLDVNTGNEIWTDRYRCPLAPRSFEGGPGCTPVIDDGRVYTLSHQGDLRCVSAADGQLIWAKDLQRDFGGKRPRWGYSESPLIIGDRLIVKPGGNNAAIVALDKTTGDLKWRSGSHGASYASSIQFQFNNQTCIASFNDYGLETLRASDGRVFGSYRWKTAYDVNAATPIEHDGYIFISSGYRTGAALLQVTGGKLIERYTTKDMANQMNPSVLIDGHVYGFSGNAGRADLVCLQFDNGAVKWRQGGLGAGALIGADGKLIMLSERGELIIAEASPAGFEPLTRFKALNDRCWVAPTLANGQLYVKDNDGRLICYDVSKP